jgi:hypothetical protein
MNQKFCSSQAHNHNIREKLINEFTKYIKAIPLMTGKDFQ